MVGSNQSYIERQSKPNLINRQTLTQLHAHVWKDSKKKSKKLLQRCPRNIFNIYSYTMHEG